jgi:hypothetical protein
LKEKRRKRNKGQRRIEKIMKNNGREKKGKRKILRK